jgi:asparagine synthase (glutamine-hydrolysing)
MCGLFGWVAPCSPERKKIRHSVDECFRSMRTRGPNDRGVAAYVEGRGWNTDEHSDCANIMLAHLRLSILDLSDRGHQPMVSPDGRFRLVYNGEVYNYRELRKTLESSGVVFITDTDTEVVLHALSFWGLSAIERFVGMFAIAFHDSLERKLYLIRDFFGIKPLFYTRTESGMFGFASELPALLSLPDVKRKVNPQRAYDYLLFGDYDSDSETMIEGAKHVLPGHYMVIDSTTGEVLNETRYWQPELGAIENLSFSEAGEKLRELFLDNIRLHLRSDVPLGAALSGGVDSSAVTAAVHHLEPDFSLQTFTYVATGSSMNEEKWADCVIESTGARAFKVAINAAEMVADLDDLIRTQGEPFGSTSIYAQYRVFQLARESGVTVTLDGQGADELLAGYFGFPGERLKSLLTSGQLTEAWKFFNATSKWPDRNRVMVFKRLVGVFTPKSLYSLFWSIGKGSRKPSWLGAEWFESQSVRFEIPSVEELYSGSRYVHRQLAKQSTQKGLPALLRHGDRNSMRFSIESRVPFLTKELAEFVLNLPEEYLIASDGKTKAVFKEAMRGIVPDKILNRKDKIGFATPEKQWLEQLSPWVEETLAEAGKMPVFHQANLQQTWQDIMSGSRSFDWQVWRWLNFIRWAKIFEVEFS